MKNINKHGQNNAVQRKPITDMGYIEHAQDGAKIAIILSWPVKELWINRRAGHSHWQSIDAKTNALTEGCASVLQALQGAHKPDWQGHRLAVTITAHKANKAPFDLDNLTGALKSHLDGIATTLGVNDNQIDRVTVIRGEPDKRTPRVELTIEALS